MEGHYKTSDSLPAGIQFVPRDQKSSTLAKGKNSKQCYWAFFSVFKKSKITAETFQNSNVV